MENKFYSYIGNIHIHTNLSDGTEDVTTIAKIAKKNNLDWIIITDHNNFDFEEGYYDGVCVIKGEEISPGDINHCLALGINTTIQPSINSQENLDNIHKQNGFGIAAHPFESIFRKNHARPIRWTDTNIIPDGIEIWNWFSSWADNYNSKNIVSMIFSFLFKNKIVYGPNSDAVKWWDYLNNTFDSLIPAIGGSDAHALNINKYIVPLKVFPYKFALKTVNNIVYFKNSLPEDFEIRKKQILSAIKNGNLTIINQQVLDKIPEVFIRNKIDNIYPGEKISFENASITVNLCKKMKINIIKDGQIIYSTIAKTIDYKINSIGKYRVEILNNKYTYALTNPFIVGN